MIAARSSTIKKGLMKANGVGIIDQDYHGSSDEIGLLMYNFTNRRVRVTKGERLAQGLVLPVSHIEWSEDMLPEKKSRGGFGSTK